MKQQQSYKSRQSSKNIAQKSEAIFMASQHTDKKVSLAGNSLQAMSSPIASASIPKLQLSSNRIKFQDVSASIEGSPLKIHPKNRFVERTKSEI